MNLKQAAMAAPYHLCTSQSETPLYQFWVVKLDNGLEVYQTPDDASLDEPNTWLRLKMYCQQTGSKILCMAYASQDYDQSKQINLPLNADGYFYSRRIRKLMAANPGFSSYSDTSEGFGVLEDGVLSITWIDSKTGKAAVENRNLNSNPKCDNHLGLIKN